MNQKVHYDVYHYSPQGQITVTQEPGVHIGWGVMTENGETFTAGIVLKEDGRIRLVKVNNITFIEGAPNAN